MPVVRLEIQDAVGHIVLDRPPANSYDKAFLDDLSLAIDAARFDPAVKGLVVRSASEKFFSAGADVKMFASPARSGLACLCSGFRSQSTGEHDRAGPRPVVEEVFRNGADVHQR